MKPGKIVGGRYCIRSVLGKGGMGVVYCADDSQMPGVRVAVKQMSLRAEDEADRESAIRQFQHEASILRSLKHPNIPRVYACFEENDQYFLVMDFIEGTTVASFVDLSGRRPPAYLPTLEQVIDWGCQIAHVLSYLHGQQPNPIVYKDLKPDNLMLTHDGTVMLLDFGIAKSLTTQGRYSTILKGVGSPGFAAPEQYARQQSDPRADLYALGATLYALLTGQIPIDSVDRQQAILDGRPDPLEPLLLLAPDTPRPLETVIKRLMAVRKSDRIQRADEVVKALEAARDGRDERGLTGVMSKVLANLWWPAKAADAHDPSPTVDQESARELLVGGTGFETIAEAVTAARDGDSIRILPGQYRESVLLDRVLRLYGDGAPEEVCLEGPLRVAAPQAEVAGLTIHVDEDAASPAVEVRRGRLILEDCQVRSDSLAGIHVHGADSFAVIRMCRIHDGVEVGVLIDDQAGADIEDCDIYRNAYAGIEVAERAEVIVRRCTIRDSAGAGIYAHDEARGTIEDCDISGSAKVGVTLSDGADPLMRRCLIHDGKGRGLVVGAASLGVFENCQIFGHAEEGVLLYDGANPEIRRCSISDGGKSGVVARSGSYGLLEDSEIVGNFEAGMVIKESADPILRHCRVSRNFVAIKADARAKGSIEGCDLRGNHRSVFDIDPKSQVKQRDNLE